MKRKDKIMECIIKRTKKHRDNYRRCSCGAVHFWKKGKKAKFIPIFGQPCVTIIEEEKK